MVVAGIGGAKRAIVREGFAAIGQDVLGAGLERARLVPTEDRAARAIGHKRRKVAELKRAAVEDDDVVLAPEKPAMRVDLIRE